MPANLDSNFTAANDVRRRRMDDAAGYREAREARKARRAERRARRGTPRGEPAGGPAPRHRPRWLALP